MKIGGKVFCKNEIRKRVGDMTQIAGIRKMKFADGKAKDLSCFEVNTGGGLEYTVLADRGLDIALARYKGTAISYLSKTAFANPSFYNENSVQGFLRVFSAGLLTTCGYTYMGAPCEVDGKSFGLHGKATGIPAEKLCYSTHWNESDYLMNIRGEMRQSIVFGENILVQRNITSRAGENVICIEDNIINEGFKKTPLMLLYHINFGFPLISSATELFVPAAKTEQFNEIAGKSDYTKIEEPQADFKEKVFYHDMHSDKDGSVGVGMFNPLLDDAFGVYIKFNKKQLPMLTQWKQMGEQDYVLGLEPGTNKTLGYAHAKENEDIIMLEPGEIYPIKIEFGIIENLESWKEFKQAFSY